MKKLIGLVLMVPAAAFAWQPAPSAGTGVRMLTEWGEKLTPETAWREYPRPQLVRDNWTCLNGLWDYAVTAVTNTPGRPMAWDGKILVPFAIESQLSGVGRLMEPDEMLWYTRKIQVRKESGRRLLLHFDGVDFRAMVFIGHREVTDVPHEGAQEPFTIDVTDFVKDGENELTVAVWDPTEGTGNSRGKQCFRPAGCFYTRCSGIWQSVWMESVPEAYVKDYNVVPDIDAGTATFAFDLAGVRSAAPVRVQVTDAGKVIAEGVADAAGKATVTMPKGFGLWSPESPKLYGFRAEYGADAFSGYFAMRKFAKGKDAKGVLRFFLNNRPYYILGTLDQGWWPDGLLTPPSEDAMAYDIRVLKDCGFNMMRKHIKVEPRRYYALCDKLGILVLQDLPSWNGDPNSPYGATAVRGYGFQRHEFKAMVDNLRKTPSIVMWVPYNEGWSQPGAFLTHSTLDWVRNYDPSRLVNGPSGYQDFEGGCNWRGNAAHRPAGVCEAGDTIDRHDYRGPSMLPLNDRRISFLGEYGGLGHPVDGHLWIQKVDANAKWGSQQKTQSWGYGGIEDTKTREGLEKTYLTLADKLAGLAAKGLAGSVYTQTTDVEIEINGVLTYDRKVLKFDPAKLRAAHEKVIRAAVAP